MKKIVLSLLSFWLLTLSANAKECNLIINPSDFQLDNQLRAPNESTMFSAVGNYWYIDNFRAFTKAIFCSGLTNGDMEQARACASELDYYLEKDSAKSKGSRVSDVIGKNKADGYKLSGHAPITKEHLCLIQNKYKTAKSWSRSSLLPLLDERQETIRKNYLEASKVIGQSEDMEAILDTIAIIENKE